MAETWQFLQGGEDLIQKMEYDGSSLIIYQGWAPAGSTASQAKWRIRKFTYSGTNLTDITYASGSPAFGFIWDSRATYTFS